MDMQCWFCDEGIDQDDFFAVQITVANLWVDTGEPVQDFFAHARCAEAHLSGKSMRFQANDLLNPN